MKASFKPFSFYHFLFILQNYRKVYGVFFKMPVKKLVLLAFHLFFITKIFSQELYIPLNIQAAIDKGTRTTDGTPGKKYWQNWADYDLKIKFNPKTRLVTGSEIIEYSNNSKDTLKKIIVRLYPNYYKRGVMRDRNIAIEDESEGVIIEKLTLNNSDFPVSADNPKVLFDGTLMYVYIPPLLPDQKLLVSINWHYTLNKGSHNRMGQVEPGAFFLAYAFPRIAVYDDTEKWDYSQYAGRNEPYFDFGNFNAEITVPKNYVVWGTGELQNMEEVFQSPVVRKYKAALVSNNTVDIIDSTEAIEKTVTAKNKWNTFKFSAAAVPDFAFAVSDHYIWKATGMVVDSATNRRTLVNTVFNNNTKDFMEVHAISCKTIEIMSFDFPGVPYPYPHMTVFQGLDQMEFPMMVNDNPLEDRAETIELTDHEIFHTYFPFYMGTNQTRYAWMDEGWATIAEWIISPMIDSTLFDDYGIEETKYSIGKESDVPLIIPSYELEDAYFVNAYPKPGFIYLYLKDMLGDSLFRKALHYYMDQWHGKHPLPWDFFNAINTGSGKNLNWYWKAWFYDYGTTDLAITSVKKNISDTEILITAKGNKPVPVYCTVYFKDGTSEEHHETAAIWAHGIKEYRLTVNSSKDINKVTLSHPYVLDTDVKNNLWVAE